MDVKLCGMCRPEDAAVAAEVGADYIGVILAPGYGRSRTPGEAAAIYGAAPGVRRVGVFVDSPPDVIRDLARRLALDVVQLHGDETPEAVAALAAGTGFDVWKAVRPRDGRAFIDAVQAYGGVADALLLDGWSGRAVGGTGTPFPWDEVAAVRGRVPAGLALIAAGGLEPGNVAAAIGRIRPDGVDVSSGVERVRGEKDPEKIVAFVAAAREAASASVEGADATGAGGDAGSGAAQATAVHTRKEA